MVSSLATLAHLGCLVEDGWGLLRGYYRGSTGTPLEGAWVTVTEPAGGFNRFATTAQDGSYSLEVPAGTILISADANGYSATQEVEITMLEGQTTTENLQITPLAESLNYIPLISKRTTLYPPDCP
jgi:hypothetical protein